MRVSLNLMEELVTRDEVITALEKDAFYKAQDLLRKLDGKGFHVESFEQGAESMHEIIADLVEALDDYTNHSKVTEGEFGCGCCAPETPGKRAQEALDKFNKRMGGEG